MKNTHTHKDGAALVIALGFLAILTIIIVAFSMQTRTERLAGREFLITAQTRQLLNAALAHAMNDIDIEMQGAVYPDFTALGSLGEEASPYLRNSLDFSTEEEYIPGSGSPIHDAYQKVLDTKAQWQTITNATDGKILGRVGYIILNTSGLLDANSVGGLDVEGNTTHLTKRGKGFSPAEIPLAPRLLDELAGTNTESALVLDRETQWRRFETQRDLNQLGNLSSPAIFTKAAENFSTFSFFPHTTDGRLGMGTTLEEITTNTALIASTLDTIGLSSDNHEFVLQQLIDYVDTNSIPEDLRYSVEPVPLINELVLQCDFSLSPVIEEETDAGTGETIPVVVSVTVTNAYSLEIEAWYPFAEQVNSNHFSLSVDDPVDMQGTLPNSLFGNIVEWAGDTALSTKTWKHGDVESATAFSGTYAASFTSAEELLTAFKDMASDIQFPSIRCINTDLHEPVDMVEKLELPMENAVEATLLPEITALANDLFDPAKASVSSNTFTIGMATIDPRLNWDGSNPNHWVEVGDNGYGDTMGEINQDVIDKAVGSDETSDRTDTIYVRNEGTIDSPYEFTYFLYDQEKPWHTFQFFKQNDTDDTRMLIDHLSTRHGSTVRGGWINPNTKNTNVLASAFYDMPVDEFVKNEFTSEPRLNREQSYKLAELILAHRPYRSQKKVSDAFANEADYSVLESIIDGGSFWEMESVLRNAMELFNPRDNLFTIFLAAQKTSNGEIQSTQNAVVYVWRDPENGKAACVFYGLTDTLQSSLGGSTWKDILKAFKP